MIYYLFLALIDIGLFLTDNWKELTFTAVASGVGVILGKRLGVRITVNYFMKTFGLQKKSTLEHQVAWLMEQERKRGNIWSAPISKPLRKNIQRNLYRSLQAVNWFAQFTRKYTKLRREQKMKNKFKSRKFILAIGTGLLIVLNEGLGLGISNESVMYFVGIIATWIVGESAIDMKRVKNNVETGDSGPAE